MMARGAWLAVLAACGSTRHELNLVEGTGVATSGRVVQLELGGSLRVDGTSIHEGFTVVPSDSPRTDYEPLTDLEVTCRGEPGTRCEVTGTQIEPRAVGTYEVKASSGRTTETWTIVVVEAVGLEIAPCGELAVDATSDLDGGVAMVTPTLVVRTRQGTRVAAIGATINDTPIANPSMYQLRATTTPTTYTLRGRLRELTTACRVTIVVRP